MANNEKSKSKILRVGFFQGQKFIEERLLHARKPVSIGSDFKKNTFVVAASDAVAKTRVLFELRNGQYALVFDKNMAGKISVGDGESYSLSELVTRGMAKANGGVYEYVFNEKAYGRVALGSGDEEVAFLFQFVTPPPPKAKPVLPASMRGGVTAAILGSLFLAVTCAISGVVQIGFIAFLLSKDWPKPKEIDYIFPDRYVNVEIKKAEEEKPEELPPEEGTEGEEEAPTKEKKPAPKKKEPEKAEKPKSSAEERAAAEADRKRRMADEVQNKTILGQIGAVSSGGSLIDTLADGAGSTSIDDAFRNSTGIETGVAGAEKSGLRSSGSSAANGKGTSVGIGDLKGTKGVGKANQGVDTGKSKERKVKVRVKLKGRQKVVGTGKLDGGSISSSIKRRRGAITQCYERYIKKNPKASGKVIVGFTIGTAGRVTKSKAVKDSVGGGVGSCVARVVKGIRFKRPKGGEVVVKKTFVFEVGS